jgi:hypothetical protein
VMILGVLNTDFTIESPPELRERARQAADTLLRGATDRRPRGADPHRET